MAIELEGADGRVAEGGPIRQRWVRPLCWGRPHQHRHIVRQADILAHVHLHVRRVHVSAGDSPLVCRGGGPGPETLGPGKAVGLVVERPVSDLETVGLNRLCGGPDGDFGGHQQLMRLSFEPADDPPVLGARLRQFVECRRGLA